MDFFRRLERQEGQASGRTMGGAIRGGPNYRLPGGMDDALPYVLHPRNTRIINSQFAIRWHPVPGAQGYTVRLWRWSLTRDRQDHLVWETTVTEPEIFYAGQPPLQVGYSYSIEVEADTGASSSQEDAPSGFELIFPEDLAVVQHEMERLGLPTLLAENLDRVNWPLYAQEEMTDEEALAIASVFVRSDLLADAASVLEPFVEQDTQNAHIYEALGELYSYMGLNTLALARYEQAILLATAQGDREAASFARLGLAEAYEALGNSSASLELLQEAEWGFRQMDNEAQANQIRRRIDWLRQTIRQPI